jgi:hypothetical protein
MLRDPHFVERGVFLIIIRPLHQKFKNERKSPVSFGSKTRKINNAPLSISWRGAGGEVRGLASPFFGLWQDVSCAVFRARLIE